MAKARPPARRGTRASSAPIWRLPRLLSERLRSAFMHSEQLANDFRRLGVAASDVVMLHAAVRAVGEVAGGPDQILWLSPPRFWVTELKA